MSKAPDNLGTIGEGGCACGRVKQNEYEIETHCHRSQCTDCIFAGVHYDKEEAKEYAEELAEYIDKSYRCDVNVVKGLRN